MYYHVYMYEHVHVVCVVCSDPGRQRGVWAQLQHHDGSHTGLQVCHWTFGACAVLHHRKSCTVLWVWRYSCVRMYMYMCNMNMYCISGNFHVGKFSCSNYFRGLGLLMNFFKTREYVHVQAAVVRERLRYHSWKSGKLPLRESSNVKGRKETRKTCKLMVWQLFARMLLLAICPERFHKSVLSSWNGNLHVRQDSLSSSRKTSKAPS